MYSSILLAALMLATFSFVVVDGRTRYILNLDLWTWPKLFPPLSAPLYANSTPLLSSHFRRTNSLLLKLDVEFPHDKVHEYFMEVAERIANASVPIVAGEIRGKENLEIKNERLMRQLLPAEVTVGVETGKIERVLPRTGLLLKSEESVRWLDANAVELTSASSLLRWVVETTGVWVPLPGIFNKQRTAVRSFFLQQIEDLKTARKVCKIVKEIAGFLDGSQQTAEFLCEVARTLEERKKQRSGKFEDAVKELRNELGEKRRVAVSAAEKAKLDTQLNGLLAFTCC